MSRIPYARFRDFRLLLAAIIIAFSTSYSYAQTVVDNSDAGFSVLTGSWSSGSFGTPIGADYRFALTTGGAPTASVEWRPNLPTDGWYDVQVYYVEGTNRADNAPYTVTHASGSTVVPVNQKVNGEFWVSLGSFLFDAGTSGAVALSNGAGPSVVIADAVRFIEVGEPEPEYRAFWADAFQQGFKTQSQVDDMIARAVAGNYNVILAEVLAYHDNATNAHGAYWDSDIIPRAPDIQFGFDPLAYMVQEAHAVGIELHAWILPFRVSTVWPPPGNTIIQNHPEWISVERADIDTGPQTIGNLYQLDPGSPGVQDYLISIVRELTSQYDIDGIHWDYIRYLQADQGYPADASYDNSGLERYRRISGNGGTPLVNDGAWSDFRRRTITELVRRANVEVAIADNPRQPLRHTAALITFGNAPGNFTSSSAYLRFQNWEHWFDQGYLDTGFVMCYFDETVFPSYFRNWVDQSIIWVHDRHIATGQGTYLNTFANSQTQIEYAKNAGVDGIATFSYAVTSSAGIDWSWYPFVSGNVFSGPSTLPTMPWKDPLLATQGTVFGRVTDGATGEPIDDATITINGFPVGFTDGNGFFVLTEINAAAMGSTIAFGALAPGYAQVQRPNVIIERAGFTEANFGLGMSLFGDYDVDSDVDFDDWSKFEAVWTGPDLGPPPAGGDAFDNDLDLDVDLVDFSALQLNFGA